MIDGTMLRADRTVRAIDSSVFVVDVLFINSPSLITEPFTRVLDAPRAVTPLRFDRVVDDEKQQEEFFGFVHA